MREIILASSSPRRKALLKQIGLTFKVDVSNYDEDMENITLSPIELTERYSSEKAKMVAKKYKNAIIIAADTVVYFKNKIYGKPHTKKNAIKMLKEFSGDWHEIITGFTIIDTKTKKTMTSHVSSKVLFKKLSSEEIEAYVKTGEPLDKAGAYGIQEKGLVLVEEVNGDYSNVVGLPIPAVLKTLSKFGVNIEDFWK